MTINELRQALQYGRELVVILKKEYPQLRINVVASLGYGVASHSMSDLEIFKKAGSIFVKSELRSECSILLALLDQSEKLRDTHRNTFETINNIKKICELRMIDLVQQMHIDNQVKIELQLDEPDTDLMNWLRDRIAFHVGFLSNESPSFSRVMLGRIGSITKNTNFKKS